MRKAHIQYFAESRDRVTPAALTGSGAPATAVNTGVLASPAIGEAIRAPEVTVVPANEATWDDLEVVLGGRGFRTTGCWCQRFKMRGREWDANAVPAAERASRMREQTQCGNPRADRTSGLVAYLGCRPVGWCAVEPRTAYVRLGMTPWKGRV